MCRLRYTLQFYVHLWPNMTSRGAESIKMKVLGEQELRCIFEDLPDYFPKSMQMQYMIGNRINNKADWPGTEFVVDTYPDYSVLIRRPILNSKEYVPWPRSYCVLIFCKDVHRLENFLQTPGCIDFSQPILFFGLSRYDVHPVVLKHCESIGTVKVQNPPEWGVVWLLHPDHLPCRPVPEGLRLGELGEEHAEQVNQEWRFSSAQTLPFFKQIAKNYPTSAIFTEDNRLVAYIMNYPDGSMGHGYLQPEYRNKGLFQTVNYDLASKIVAMGYSTARSHVMKLSEAPQKAYHKMGAKKVDEEVYCIDWVHFTPKVTTK